jgi:hypothetical protein
MIEAFTVNVSGNADPIPNPPLPHVSLLDMLRLQRDLVVVTRIASIKEYTRAPLAWFPASTGVKPTYSGIGNVVDDGFVTGNNGSSSVGGKRVFASPIYVEGGEALVVDFLAPRGAVNGLSFPPNSPGRIRLRTFLDGYRRRPVA